MVWLIIGYLSFCGVPACGEIEFDRRLGAAAEMAGQLWKMLIKAHHNNLIDRAIATKPPDHTNN